MIKQKIEDRKQKREQKREHNETESRKIKQNTTKQNFFSYNQDYMIDSFLGFLPRFVFIIVPSSATWGFVKPLGMARRSPTAKRDACAPRTMEMEQLATVFNESKCDTR